MVCSSRLATMAGDWSMVKYQILYGRCPVCMARARARGHPQPQCRVFRSTRRDTWVRPNWPERGMDNMDIANSKLNHDQRLNNTLKLTNRQKQTKTMILVKMIFEFNIPLAFIVLLFALFAWILFSVSRRRKHAPLFWVTWNVELLWDNLVITVCAQNAKWLANHNYRIFKILFRKMKQRSYWGPRWVAAHDMVGFLILTLLLHWHKHWTIYFEKVI